MPLQTAEQVLKQIPKPRAKRPRKQIKDECIIICGSTAWTNRKRMAQVLRKLNPVDIAYVVTGTSKGAELLAVSVCKELKLNVLQVHQQPHFAENSLPMRNGKAFVFFKPTHVYVFHDTIEASVSSAYYIKLAKRKGIAVTHITSKGEHTTPARP